MKISFASEPPREDMSRRNILLNCFSGYLCSGVGTLVAQSGATAAPAKSAEARKSYPDGRPAAVLRLDAEDAGPIIRHGEGPARCDYLGAREAICFWFH